MKPEPSSSTPSRGLDPADLAGQDAALLSAIEVGLGSVLHSLRVPFSGQFLSLNQIFLLSRSTRKLAPHPASRTLAFRVSCVAAILKSLSPAGKKLTPMLAIAAQGFLFGLGPLLLGPNGAGLWLGATLSGLWAFLQPALLYFLIFGSPLFQAAGSALQKLTEVLGLPRGSGLWLLLGFVAAKILLSWLAAAAACWLPEGRLTRYQRRLAALGPQPARSGSSASLPPLRGALRDLTQPVFLLSLGLTLAFLLFAESDWSGRIWGLLRPLAAGLLVFYLIRWLPGRLRGRLLQAWPLRAVSPSLELALTRLREHPTAGSQPRLDQRSEV